MNCVFTKCLCFIVFFLGLLFFTGCEYDKSILESSYETTVMGITFKVSPTYLKSGETVRLEVSQVEGESVPIVLFSKSLDFEEQVMTPAVVEKVVIPVGRHDVGFKYDAGAVSIEKTTTITVE